MIEAKTSQIEIGADQGGDRLDRALAQLVPSLSRSRIQALIRNGHVSAGARRLLEPSLKVATGELITLAIPAPAPAKPAPERIPLAVVFEDDEIIVIDKPAGLVVHPGAGHGSGTLVNALLAHCGPTLSGIGGVQRPGIVHRLDKDTSGLLVVAKTDRAHAGLAAQFADHGRTGPLARTYLAFVWGSPEPPQGSVDAALARSSADREKIAVVAPERGRRAVTHYVSDEIYRRDGEAVATLLRCTLDTGRTHQIRVHLAHLKHPLLGDPVYGGGFRTKANRLDPDARTSLDALGRQALHAALLQFEHPATGRVLRFDSELPADLAELRRVLRSR